MSPGVHASHLLTRSSSLMLVVGSLKGHVRMAADSTMLRMVKRLMALSLGTQRAQLEQRTGLVWPRPFLLRPLEINQHHVLRSLCCATQPPHLHVPQCASMLLSNLLGLACLNRVHRHHCGDHVDWETLPQIVG